MNTQLLKGVLEGFVLGVIEAKKETYGYEIRDILRQYGLNDLSEGTLYPLYLRLEKNKMVKSELKESPLGPKRKYYSLTPQGKEALREFHDDWEYLDMIYRNLGNLI